MENAIDAIKIAFAAFVLVLAITVSIFSFTNAKAASDVIINSKDKTSYYEYQGAAGKASENRIVGLETVIPTLYRYYKENYTVVFKQGNYNSETGEVTEVRNKIMYTSASNNELWSSSYETFMQNKYGKNLNVNNNIFSFDLDEETLRHEAWTGSTEKIKLNLDAFLNGSTFINPADNSEYKNYGKDSNLGNKGFIEKYKDEKFIETIGEYTYTTNQTELDEDKSRSLTNDETNQKKKRVITFTLINN